MSGAHEAYKSENIVMKKKRNAIGPDPMSEHNILAISNNKELSFVQENLGLKKVGYTL